MSAFKMLILTCALILFATCLLAAGEDGSGSSDQKTLIISLVDHPVTLPVQVLKQLIDTTVNSTGLFALWNNAIYLAKVTTLKKKVRDITYHAGC